MKKARVRAHARRIGEPKKHSSPAVATPGKGEETSKDLKPERDYGHVKLIPLAVTDAPPEFYEDDSWCIGIVHGRSR